jgi:hypothetical protein
MTMDDPLLGTLLGHWHQWRRGYSHERGYTRQCLDFGASTGDDDDLELAQLRAIEEAVSTMPREEQIALQHVARAECLGVEVMFSPLLLNREHRELLVARALETLRRRLLQAGVL